MPGFILNDGAVVPPSVYSAMNTVLNKKLGTSQVYPPRDWAAIVKDLVPLPLKSVSGSIAHFEDGADTVPLKSLTYRFTPSQAGAGDPSPSNPRPITGVSSVNVTSAGKNLVDSDDYYESYKQADGSYISKGSEANAIVIPISPALIGKQVTFSASLRKPEGSTIGAIRVICYVNGVQTNGNNVTGSTYATSSITFTPVTTNDYVKISYGSSGGQNMQYKDVQLELGSTATTYEPYQATLIPVSLGQTVYGGEGNEAGEFSSTYKLADLSTMDWDSNAPNQDGYIRFVSHSAFEDKKNGYNLFCDKFPVKNSLVPSSPTAIGISGYTSNANIYIAVESSMLTGDLSTNAGRNTAFRNWISDNGLQILYELATPDTLSVDPVAISSRLGVNNIYLDLAGSEIECEYYADPTLSTQ